MCHVKHRHRCQSEMDKITHTQFMQEIEDRGHTDGCPVLAKPFLERKLSTCNCDRVETYQMEFADYAEYRK